MPSYVQWLQEPWPSLIALGSEFDCNGIDVAFFVKGSIKEFYS